MYKKFLQTRVDGLTHYFKTCDMTISCILRHTDKQICAKHLVFSFGNENTKSYNELFC